MQIKTTECDVLVIGAGPAGYPAAIRAAQAGLSTVIVDAMVNPDDGACGAWGGVCANMGCIPSKALLAASHAYASLSHGLEVFGIDIDPKGVTMDYARMQAHRASCVKSSNKGLSQLFTKYHVRAVAAAAKFEAREGERWAVGVTPVDSADGAEPERILARNVIIACGTKARALPGIEFDEKVIVSHTGALKFTEAPKSLGVIGAGVIGLELGSVWSRLGTEVTLFDVARDILPSTDAVMRRTVKGELKKQGLVFHMGVRVEAVEKTAEGVKVSTVDKNGTRNEYVFDKLLVAAGRTSLAPSLAPESVGLKLDTRGYVEVDACGRTNLPGVWAAGDVAAGSIQLAHYAHEQGVNVARSIASGRPVRYESPVPAVVYIDPEVAWVGETEEAARSRGIAVRTGVCPFAANGRAKAQAQTTGFVKVVCEAATDRILGVHIVGEGAADLCAEAAAAMAFGATAEALGLVMHPHPSLSEALAMAALASRREATDL